MMPPTAQLDQQCHHHPYGSTQLQADGQQSLRQATSSSSSNTISPHTSARSAAALSGAQASPQAPPRSSPSSLTASPSHRARAAFRTDTEALRSRSRSNRRQSPPASGHALAQRTKQSRADAGHSPSPSPSPASSYASSNQTSNDLRSISSSSSLGTSPLSHADQAATVSPRTRDLIQAQRDLYQRKNSTPSATGSGRSPQPTTFAQQHNNHLHQMISTVTSQQQQQQPTPTSHLPSSPGTETRHDAAATASDVMMASPKSSSTALNGDSPARSDNTPSSSTTDRGAKSRRASPGGSRITERGRSSSNLSHRTADGEAAQSQSQGPSHQERSPQPTTSSPSTSSSAQPPTPSLSTASAVASSHALPAPSRPLPRLDLAKYPQQDLLRILAALLHQMSTANDALRPSTSASQSASSSGTPASENGSQSGQPSTDRRSSTTTASLEALGSSSSTLCFHARNIPSISIESYLLRILKYCPTTNDVFLSLLVYFDRMSKMGAGANPRAGGASSVAEADAGLTQPQEQQREQENRGPENRSGAATPSPHPGMKGFAIDSYNVHRLVIAGVTVASKFFSDVFYTNSRYAKVGGLPVHELNQLELQFLLLNDFHLMITMEEIQQYADQLLAYSQGASASDEHSPEGGPPSASPRMQPTWSSQEQQQQQQQQQRREPADRSAAAAVRMQ